MQYLEVGCSEYYRNLGLRVYDEKLRDQFDLATVKATLEYKRPVRVDDMMVLYVRASRIGNTSLTHQMEIYLEGTAELHHRAEIVLVDYDTDSGAARQVLDGIRDLIAHYERTGEVLPLDRFPDLVQG
jgi:acyl-CoA thioester hydrolase